MMSFKCGNRCKIIVFDHLSLSFNAFNTVFMCKMRIKYQYASPSVCAYAHVFFLDDQGVHLLGHVR